MLTWDEWAFEGNLNIIYKVGEPERTLRYKIGHMLVCMSGCIYTSSRVAPQEFYHIIRNDSSCPCNSIIVWDKSFLYYQKI